MLRDGRRVFHGAAGVGRDALMRIVVAAEVEPVEKTPRRGGGEPILRFEGLSGMCLRDVNFKIGRGEVPGIAGSGRSELSQVVFGDRPAFAGRVVLEGRDVIPIPAD